MAKTKLINGYPFVAYTKDAVISNEMLQKSKSLEEVSN